MSSISLLNCALALLLATSALAQEPPDRLYGEQPYEEPFVDNPSDDWLPSFVPNLVDLPAAELVERHHPTLEMSLRRRAFRYQVDGIVANARQDGVRFAFHVRLGRDLQLTLQALALEPELSFFDAMADLPGTLGGALFELKYLSPYEVVGIRTAAGVRVSAYDEDDVRFFPPDEFTLLRSAYVTLGGYPRKDLRLHLTLMSVFAHGVPGLPAPDYGLLGAGFEYTAWTRGDNYVRLVGEVVDRSFDRDIKDVEASFGTLVGASDAFANAMIRVRSGILQIDLATRHVSDSGWDEQSITVVKRF